MKSSAQYVQNQLVSIIGYCKECGEPITGFPGTIIELCNKHEQDQYELELLLDELTERIKISDYSGSLTRNIL